MGAGIGGGATGDDGILSGGDGAVTRRLGSDLSAGYCGRFSATGAGGFLLGCPARGTALRRGSPEPGAGVWPSITTSTSLSPPGDGVRVPASCLLVFRRRVPGRAWRLCPPCP